MQTPIGSGVSAEGWIEGGEIIAADTPERAAKEKRRFTEQYLKPLLEKQAPPG